MWAADPFVDFYQLLYLQQSRFWDSNVNLLLVNVPVAKETPINYHYRMAQLFSAICLGTGCQSLMCQNPQTAEGSNGICHYRPLDIHSFRWYSLSDCLLSGTFKLHTCVPPSAPYVSMWNPINSRQNLYFSQANGKNLKIRLLQAMSETFRDISVLCKTASYTWWVTDSAVHRIPRQTGTGRCDSQMQIMQTHVINEKITAQWQPADHKMEIFTTLEKKNRRQGGNIHPVKPSEDR